MDHNHRNLINLVRRAQQAISRDHLLQNLAQYPARDAFAQVAQLVVETYFPRAVQRANTANIADLVEMYIHAFVLAPLQYRVPGVFRPDWSIGTVLSWFRRCTSQYTNQWRWCTPVVDIDRSPEAVFSALTNVVNIRDTVFAQNAATTLCNMAASEGRKADAARLFLDPFAAAPLDRAIDEIFHVRKSGPVRRKLRAQKQNVASYLRIGDRAVLLADVETSKRTESETYQWKDIREVPIKWQGYVIEWVNKGGHLWVRLEEKVVVAALREIKAVMEAEPQPHRRFRAVVHIAETFLHAHRYATGSLALLRDFNQKVKQAVAKEITANIPELVYPIGHVEVYNQLVLPIGNPFLSPLPSMATESVVPRVVSHATWMHFWNPYRTTNAWAPAETS